MILHVSIHDEFGEFCGSGDDAGWFRRTRIDPFADLASRIELDFAGVSNANSSFCNALVANLVSRGSPDILQRLRFLNCSPVLRVMLRAAVDLGLARAEANAALQPA